MLMLKAYKYFCKEILLSWDELDELGEGDLGEAVFSVGRSMKCSATGAEEPPVAGDERMQKLLRGRWWGASK